MKFNEMGIRSEILHSLENLGFTHPTDIQEKAIPFLKKGMDLIGQSETGSGKTLAFALPLLDTLTPGRGVQALILTPTRELAKQIKDEFDKVSGGSVSVTTVYGGVGFEPQIHGLINSDVIVATPGRMLDHLRRGNARFEKVKYLVLDEADRMLEMGFIEDVETIIRHVPQGRQMMLFSATMPHEIVRISKRHLKDPVHITTKQFVDTQQLTQVYVDCMDNEKFSLLVHLIRIQPPARGIVFCARRGIADSVAQNLSTQGIKARALHGGLTQSRREQTLASFHGGGTHILVATDVASRGLDIKGVTHIYNYNIPDNPDDYTHRIGRTARAGKSGKAISLISPMDYDNFRKITQTLDIDREMVGWFKRIPFITNHFSKPVYHKRHMKTWRSPHQ